MTTDTQRLLEGLELERLSTERAIQEIKRIADKTLGDMSPGYYVARMQAISQLAQIAAERPSRPAAGEARGINDTGRAGGR